jgi:hypothetical protein
MPPAPVAAVLAAVNGPTTQVTSRLEIYETDAVTRWVGDTQGRLIDGSVTVDYDRDERRAFDITLDNYDNALAHDPNGGFWYDKVLKLYKGLTYQQEAFRNVYSNIRKQYMYNPSAEGLSGTAVVRTNLFPNPHVQNAATSWGVYNPNGTSTLARQTTQSGWAYGVTTSVRATYTVASTTVDGGILTTPANTMPALPAKPYGAFIQVRCSKIQRLQPRIDFYNSSSVYISSAVGATVVAAANTVTDLNVVNGIAPAGTAYVAFVVVAVAGTSGTIWSIGDWLETTNLQMEMTDATLAGAGGTVYTGMFSGTFGPGSYGISDTTFTWAGTAHASASQMRQPASAAVFPISGLTLGTPVSVEYAQGGSRSYKLIPDATGADSYLEIFNQSRADILGKTLTISATINVPVVQTNPDSRARSIMVYVQAPSLANGVMQGYQSTPAPNAIGSTALNLTVTIPADSTYVSARFYNGSSSPTQRVFWDSILVEQGTSVGTFFHGASADVGNTHNSWDGAQWVSTSTQQRIDVESYYQTLTWETQIGEFVIDQLSEAHFPHQLHVTGRDYTKRCLTAKFVTSTTFATGQAIETLVRNIAANAGITKFLLPTTGKTVDRSFTYERGVERWKAMKEIADAYGYELFFDGQGYLVMREYKDPVYAALSVVLSTGQAGNLVTYEKSTNDTRVYNHIVVTGESSDTSVAPVFAEALNTEPSSPTRIARLGDRLYEYTSSFITTVAQCQDTADKFLKIHALEEYDFNFSSIAYPWLEVGDIAQFIDPRPGVGDPDRFLMSTLSIPLKGGPMTGNAKRVTVVG